MEQDQKDLKRELEITNMSLRHADLADEIISAINNSDLSISSVYYVVKDVFELVTRRYEDTITSMRQKRERLEEELKNSSKAEATIEKFDPHVVTLGSDDLQEF